MTTHLSIAHSTQFLGLFGSLTEAQRDKLLGSKFLHLLLESAANDKLDDINVFALRKALGIRNIPEDIYNFNEPTPVEIPEGVATQDILVTLTGNTLTSNEESFLEWLSRREYDSTPDRPSPLLCLTSVCRPTLSDAAWRATDEGYHLANVRDLIAYIAAMIERFREDKFTGRIIAAGSTIKGAAERHPFVTLVDGQIVANGIRDGNSKFLMTGPYRDFLLLVC